MPEKKTNYKIKEIKEENNFEKKKNDQLKNRKGKRGEEF